MFFHLALWFSSTEFLHSACLTYLSAVSRTPAVCHIISCMISFSSVLLVWSAMLWLRHGEKHLFDTTHRQLEWKGWKMPPGKMMWVKLNQLAPTCCQPKPHEARTHSLCENMWEMCALAAGTGCEGVGVLFFRHTGTASRVLPRATWCYVQSWRGWREGWSARLGAGFQGSTLCLQMNQKQKEDLAHNSLKHKTPCRFIVKPRVKL